MLATPRKTDADRGGRGDVLSQLRGYPSKHAGMPTPRASDAHHGAEVAKAHAEKATGVSLVTALHMGAKEMFHKPTAKANFASASMQKWESCRPWNVMFETLPTPTKRDKRLDSKSPAHDCRHSPALDAVVSGAMTGKASDKWIGARLLAQLLQSRGLTGTAALPVTYGWMMGYPPGWLSRALRSAVHAEQLRLVSSLKPSGTRSARKSRKPSATPSSE
jgi:hypothetical protein